MINTDKNILIINLGLRSIRAIVFSPKGEKLSQSWFPVKTFIKGNHVEQNPDEWWQLSKETIKEATKEESIRNNIGFMSITSSACCLVCTDENGNTIGNSLLVSDKRSTAQAEKLKKCETLKELFKNKNMLPVPSYMIPKIMWLKENQEEIFQDTAVFGSSNSFLTFKFTGKQITDPLDAEKSYYNLKNKRYPQEILDLLDLKEENFPEVVEVGTEIGIIKNNLSFELDLRQDIKFIVTTYDALCAFWGAGVSEEGDACNVCGTCSSLRVYSEQATNTESPGVLSQIFSKLNVHVVGGSNNMEGGLLEWAKKCFYGDSYFNDEKFLFELMEEEAKNGGFGADGLLFLPYLIGERAPFFDTDVRGMLFGMERFHTRKNIIRSIFESTGFLARNMLDAIEATGIKVKELRVSGGLVRNEFICQLRADITGKRVILIDEVETTALGSLFLAARAIDHSINAKDLSPLVKIKKVFEPDPEMHKKYNHLYQMFTQVYKTNQNLFKLRKDIFKSVKEDKEHVIANL